MDLIIGILGFVLLIIFVWMTIDGFGVDEAVSLLDLGLENRINQEKAVKNHQPDKYALLIRGDNEERFVADTSLTYQVLLENGFKSEHIYILANAKKKKETYFHPIDDFATKKNLEMIINHLSGIIDEEDLLLICLIDHGNREMIISPVDPRKELVVSTFSLGAENLNEVELELYLSNMRPKIGILLFEFCFSGGFTKKLGGNYVAIASTDSGVEGYSKGGNSFIGCICEALSWRKRSEADANKDGRVNLQEAVDYAKTHHYKTKGGKQKPVVKSVIPLDKIFIDE